MYGEACEDLAAGVHDRRAAVVGSGTRSSLPGTIELRAARMQATYAGKALYYYAQEEPGEVHCHNVDLNGGLCGRDC